MPTQIAEQPPHRSDLSEAAYANTAWGALAQPAEQAHWGSYYQEAPQAQPGPQLQVEATQPTWGERHPKLQEIAHKAGEIAVQGGLYAGIAANGALTLATDGSARDAIRETGQIIADSEDGGRVNETAAKFAAAAGYYGAKFLADKGSKE